ncbi:MAG TPA: glycine oxidase ThiO [Chloroflexota bacterium]|nr:glycine oxidase ThiO [Chloroflexota bacterium]
MATTDVLIIGGGVIGASIAYHLSQQGVGVTVLERHRTGGHASRASAGLLHPLYDRAIPEPLRALSAASFALFPDLVARLRELTGVDAAYQPCGWLRVALREDAAAALQARDFADSAAREYHLRLIDGDEARTLEPALSPAVLAAVHAPCGAQVYVPALLQAYLQAAARLGATIRAGVEARDLWTADSRVLGATTLDGERIAADHTVLAGGAWTALLAAQLGVPVPVFPMRGQILSLHALPAPLRQVVFGSDVYLAPKVDGSIVAGATYEDAGFDDRLTAAGVASLLASAQLVVPALRDATFRQAWVGLRPASRDGLPLLGPVLGWQGVSVATGHTAEGVLLSPITGLLMAQHVRGQPTALSLAPFSLAHAR